MALEERRGGDVGPRYCYTSIAGLTAPFGSPALSRINEPTQTYPLVGLQSTSSLAQAAPEHSGKLKETIVLSHSRDTPDWAFQFDGMPIPKVHRMALSVSLALEHYTLEPQPDLYGPSVRKQFCFCFNSPVSTQYGVYGEYGGVRQKNFETIPTEPSVQLPERSVEKVSRVSEILKLYN